MFDIHPDDNDHRIRIRQEIVRQGIQSARHPGDVAALREKIGRFLIATGERIRGYEHRPMTAPPRPVRTPQIVR